MKHYVEHLSRELLRYSFTIIALIFVLFGTTSIMALHVSTTRVLENSADALSAYWTSSISTIEQGVHDLAANKVVSDVLLSESYWPAQSIAQANSLVYDTARVFPQGSSIAVVNKTGHIVSSNLFLTNRTSLEQSSLTRTLTHALTDNPEKVVGYPLGLTMLPPHEGAFAVAAALPEPDGTWQGAMIIGIAGQEGLREVVRAEAVDRIIISDRFSNVIFDSAYRSSIEHSAPLAAKLDAQYPNFLTMRTDGVDYFYSSATDPSTRVTSTALTPQLFFKSSVVTGFLVMCLVAVVVLFLTWRLSRRRIQRSKTALEGLAHGIDQWFDGHLDYRLSTPEFAEFSGIYDSFNLLVNELEHQQMENMSLEQSRNALEVRHLETQFNPHFVFNTLELLRYMIRTDPQAASRIVLDLAQLLRYSIQGGNQLVRLSDDMEYMQRYLDLHRLRLSDRLRYSITYSPDVSDALIPRLIIQPLLENALTHGENNQEHVVIAIDARSEDDDLVITITDNGNGIDAEMLREIEQTLASIQQPHAHLGIYLVHRIISLIYGEPYGVKVTSNCNGTCVTITLPFEI